MLVATSSLDSLLHEHLMLNCCSSLLFSMKLPVPAVISNLSRIRHHAAKDPSAGTQITSTPPATPMNTFPSDSILYMFFQISSLARVIMDFTFLVYLQ